MLYSLLVEMFFCYPNLQFRVELEHMMCLHFYSDIDES